MRKIIHKLFPEHTKRRKVLKKTKQIGKRGLSGIKNSMILVAKSFYRIIPSRRLKNKLKKMKNHIPFVQTMFDQDKNMNYKGKYRVYDKFKDFEQYSEKLENLNKTIGIHLHLYYEDTLEEFVYFFKKIPYSFDLYVSTAKTNDKKAIEKALNEIPNANKVKVIKTPNKGRDFGPMFAEFGNDLKNYDYLLHVHSKKSLRMGSSQDEWRQHLLKGLLGSENLIKNIFYMMENENIGIAYPEAYESNVYWCTTWLGALSKARSFCSRLDLNANDEYMNFSVGSMFWIKTDIVKDIFNLNLTWDDFEEEEGQADGTLPYVLERIFGLLAKKHNYDFLVYDDKINSFYKNYSRKNLEQYKKLNVDEVVKTLSKYDIVSFDIFDTLIARTIFKPSDLFKIMDMKLKQEKLIKEDFQTIRPQAEVNVRIKKNYIGDCTIHEIYDEIAILLKLDEQTKNEFKQMEIDLEKKCLIPRKDMLEVFNQLKAQGKRIVLNSDMYLTSDILIDILDSCGYNGYEELLVSSETNCRKDNGTIWDYFNKLYDSPNFIHVGDNEESDIHMAGDRGIPYLHVMQGKKMFGISYYGYYLANLNNKCELGDSVLYGHIYNKQLFNSPFIFHNSEYAVEDIYSYGYSVIGPVIFYYLLWLIKNLENSDETLLFLSREGYYLQKLYQLMKKRINLDYLDEVEEYYFQTSRRAISIAQAKTDEDFCAIFDIEYYGTLESILKYRFNLKIENIKNRAINLPKDKDFMIEFFKKHKEKFYQSAKIERENYFNYINDLIPDYKDRNLTVIDLGYAGTTQLYLSNLLEQKVGGKYFVVTNKLKPMKIGCSMESCFNEINPNMENNHPLYLNSLLLECFLTAPNGQLMYFDDKGQPVYTEESTIAAKIDDLDLIYKAASDLINDMFDFYGSDITNVTFTKEYIIDNFLGFVRESKNFSQKHPNLFQFDDYYCRDTQIDVSNN